MSRTEPAAAPLGPIVDLEILKTVADLGLDFPSTEKVSDGPEKLQEKAAFARALPRPDFFKRRRRINLVLWVLVLGAAVLSGIIARYDVWSSLTAVPKSLRWMGSNLIPDAQAVEKLPNILKKLGDTVLMSLIATVCASVLALVFGIMGSKTTRPGPAIAAASRGLASFFRNIPVVAWAMILLISFGQSPFTGFLAIFFESFGFLTRTFIETIDETAESSVEALRATGSTYLHTVFAAVFPSVMPQIVSWMLYMLDTNIRSAALVGILTGTGIGFAFSLYYNRFNYTAASLCVVGVVVIVLLIEAVSNRIRRVIL